MFQRVSTMLWVTVLVVMALVGVAVVTHYQTALAVREASPSMVLPTPALHVGGDFSRMTLSPDIAATADGLEMVP
jgi:hypothetical protein